MATATRPAIAFPDDDFHFDLLQGQLVVDRSQQRQRALTRHFLTAQLDARFFPRQLGMRARHFTIENEGSIGVEFLLKFVQLLVAAVPGPRLIHDQQNFAPHLIEGEKIDNAGVHYATGRQRSGFRR
jgi:hypothetical protein